MPRLNADRIVFGLVGLALAGSVTLCYYSPSAVAQREREATLGAARGTDVASAPAPPANAGLEVRVFEVGGGGAPVLARVSGLLEPLRSVTLSASVAGTIAEVLVDEHASVEAGAVLVRLDATALRAGVERLQASRIRVRSTHRLRELELERLRSLLERSVASSAELDRAENAERAAFAELGEIRASLAEARDLLERSEIRAPFAGVVSWLDLEPGAYLRPGERVAELLDLASIELEVGVTDRQVVALKEGDAVDVRVDVFPERPFPGHIARVGRAADGESRRYPVVVRVPNPGESLLPGMVAEAVFRLGAEVDAIRIPRRATLREYELSYVWVLEERDGAWRARRRRVALRPVPFQPQWVEVTEGLEAGERIAASGVADLRDGSAVRVAAPAGEGAS